MAASFFNRPRRAFVTGGSRGIGLAIKTAFESRGVEVISPARSELDLSDSRSIEGFVRRHADLQVDILINNAGINFPDRLEKIEVDNWNQAMQVNSTAPFLLSRHFAAGMRERQWGRVVNVSSIFSLVTKEGRAAYSAAKSALNGLTRTCAVEWGRDGVLVNAVALGYVNTDLTRQNNSPADIARICEMIPAGRMAEPAEMAEMIVFLASDLNAYMTGQVVTIDGGFVLK